MLNSIETASLKERGRSYPLFHPSTRLREQAGRLVVSRHRTEAIWIDALCVEIVHTSGESVVQILQRPLFLLRQLVLPKHPGESELPFPFKSYR
jgi:hypothetical protein